MQSIIMVVVVALTSVVSTSSLSGGSENGQHCGMVVTQNHTWANYTGTGMHCKHLDTIKNLNLNKMVVQQSNASKRCKLCVRNFKHCRP